MSKELMVTQARLPVNYEHARQAISECRRVDECKEWADKAEALASYARQRDDDVMLNAAMKIKARAVQQAGELLKQFNAQQSGLKQNRGGGTPPTVTQRAVGEAAGWSVDQQKQAVRVANVPKKQFDDMVEVDKPATITMLANAGKKGGKPAKQAPFRNEFIDWTSSVEKLSEIPKCGLGVLAKRDPEMVPEMLKHVRKAIINLEKWRKALS